YNLMRKHTDKKYYATGDPYQLSPIESLNTTNEKESKAFYKKAINSLFNVNIILKKNKRCKDLEKAERMEHLCESIRNAPNIDTASNIILNSFKTINTVNDISNVNICYYNKTCEKVNNIILKRDNINLLKK